jgi:hypothetical protein
MYKKIFASIVIALIISAYAYAGGDDATNFSLPLEKGIVTFPIEIALYAHTIQTGRIILESHRNTTPWQVHKRITEILYKHGALVLYTNNNKSNYINSQKETTILALLEKNQNAKLRFITS